MPQLQPFWDSAFTKDNPGPYVGATYVANPWDTATVKGVKMPGIVTVSVPRARHLDVKSFPGVAGAIVTPLGYEPLRFTVTVRIWTPAQWEALQSIMWFLLPLKQTTRAGEKPKAVFDVYHPALAAMSVSSAMCIKLGPLTGGQDKTLAIEFLERRSSKAAVFTPTTSEAVNAAYNAETLAAQQVQAADGRVTTFAPTQGPQPKPSRAELTLVPTT